VAVIDEAEEAVRCDQDLLAIEDVSSLKDWLDFMLYCEPTVHRLVRRVFGPPLYSRMGCLWEPTAAARSGFG